MLGGEEGAGFSQKLVFSLQVRDFPTQPSDFSCCLLRRRLAVVGGGAPEAFFFDPAAEQLFAEVELLGDSPDRLSSIEDQTRGVAAVLLGISASLSHVNILPQGTVAPLVWVSTTRG